MKAWYAGGAAATLLLITACNGCRTSSQAAPSASASTGAPASPGVSAVTVLRAEHRRDAAAVPEEVRSSRDVVTRRRAARALARIADAKAADALLSMLRDEDGEVVTWAAYGLGYACKGRELPTVRALVLRAASLAALAPDTAATAPLVDPNAAIADALARCGTQEAEATLRAWLLNGGKAAESAALALGRLASRQRRLDDASVVALLDAASDPDAAVQSALFAFTRLGALPEPVETRLREVARGMIGKTGSQRNFAVRCLGRAGQAAVPDLEKFAADSKEDPSTRAEAARELARQGKAGDEALGRVVKALAEGAPLDAAALSSAQYGVLSTALESMQEASAESDKALARLETLATPSSAGASVSRRVQALHCAAAALRAKDNPRYDRLQNCQTGKDTVLRDLAVLRVLDRAPLSGTRLKTWLELGSSKEPRVRQAALTLLNKHPEVATAYEVLAVALEAEQDGTVATAADVLAAHPARASKGATRREDDDAPAEVVPHEKVVEALQRAFTKRRAPDATEVRQSLIAAAGGLGLMRLKPEIEKDCKSAAPTLRAAAQQALQRLGDRNRRCDAGALPPAPEELERLRKGSVRLTLTTDVGELSMVLDADLAPVTVTRVATLAEAKFYDGIVFHRVVPGFVAQFGDPGADGYGGAGGEPLRCETSPVDFSPMSVGVALSGRDTGSSQLFVTLGPFPHLDGDYAWLGRAEGPWAKLAPGDRILTARLTR
ncbi:MAG: peptidylprolyl isomerase [Polyangiaceae bacterium]